MTTRQLPEVTTAEVAICRRGAHAVLDRLKDEADRVARKEPPTAPVGVFTQATATAFAELEVAMARLKGKPTVPSIASAHTSPGMTGPIEAYYLESIRLSKITGMSHE